MTLGRVLAIGCVVGLLVACGGGNVASHLADPPRFAPEGEARCTVVKSQAHPLVVEWPSADRLTLENKIREGLVAVHYVGCEMRVLERCSAPGKYTYLGATRSEDQVVVRDEDDLYANFPLGAAKLEAKLAKTGALTVDMDLVGRFEAERQEVRADELVGDCQGATHFVYGVAVGAFDFHAGAEATMGAGATIAGIGSAGHSQEEKETLRKSGDEAACLRARAEDRAPPDGCGALVRLEVVPLGAPRPIVPTCPDGTRWDGSACLAVRRVTEVTCPEGSSWSGEACTTTRVVTQVRCPAGAWWDGKACAAKVVCPPDMVWLPGGRFATSGGYADFDPADGTTLQPFCMDRTEVTVGAYEACVRAGRCSAAGLQVTTERIDGKKGPKTDPLCNYGATGREGHPVNCVTWSEAVVYCRAEGKRLPKEWEWMWAALGGVDPTIAVDLPPPSATCQGRIKEDGAGALGTCDVGEADAGGPGGIRGLYGNVAEWTSSRLPWAGFIARGASWDQPKNATVGLLDYSHDEVMAETASRNDHPAGTRRTDLGFRCVK